MRELEKKIEAYINGEMTPKEVIVFEKKISNDPNLKKDIDTYKEMSILYNKKDWELTSSKTTNRKVQEYETFLKSEKGQEITSILKDTEQEYFKKTFSSKVKRPLIYLSSIAAILCVILISVYNFNKDYTNVELAEKYKDWSDLPSFSTKGLKNNNLIEAEKLFKQHSYKEALGIFNNSQINNDKHLIDIYIGISQLQLGEIKKAINTFKALVDHWKYGPRARWYLVLAYLKDNNSTEAKKELELLIEDPNNFNYQKAKKLLNEIK